MEESYYIQSPLSLFGNPKLEMKELLRFYNELRQQGYGPYVGKFVESQRSNAQKENPSKDNKLVTLRERACKQIKDSRTYLEALFDDWKSTQFTETPSSSFESFGYRKRNSDEESSLVALLETCCKDSIKRSTTLKTNTFKRKQDQEKVKEDQDMNTELLLFEKEKEKEKEKEMSAATKSKEEKEGLRSQRALHVDSFLEHNPTLRRLFCQANEPKPQTQKQSAPENTSYSFGNKNASRDLFLVGPLLDYLIPMPDVSKDSERVRTETWYGGKKELSEVDAFFRGKISSWNKRHPLSRSRIVLSVILIGVPGCGKTQILRKIAENYQLDYDSISLFDMAFEADSKSSKTKAKKSNNAEAPSASKRLLQLLKEKVFFLPPEVQSQSPFGSKGKLLCIRDYEQLPSPSFSSFVDQVVALSRTKSMAERNRTRVLNSEDDDDEEEPSQEEAVKNEEEEEKEEEEETKTASLPIICIAFVSHQQQPKALDKIWKQHTFGSRFFFKTPSSVELQTVLEKWKSACITKIDTLCRILDSSKGKDIKKEKVDPLGSSQAATATTAAERKEKGESLERLKKSILLDMDPLRNETLNNALLSGNVPNLVRYLRLNLMKHDSLFALLQTRTLPGSRFSCSTPNSNSNSSLSSSSDLQSHDDISKVYNEKNVDMFFSTFELTGWFFNGTFPPQYNAYCQQNRNSTPQNSQKSSFVPTLSLQANFQGKAKTATTVAEIKKMKDKLFQKHLARVKDIDKQTAAFLNLNATLKDQSMKLKIETQAEISKKKSHAMWRLECTKWEENQKRANFPNRNANANTEAFNKGGGFAGFDTEAKKFVGEKKSDFLLNDPVAGDSRYKSYLMDPAHFLTDTFKTKEPKDFSHIFYSFSASLVIGNHLEMFQTKEDNVKNHLPKPLFYSLPHSKPKTTVREDESLSSSNRSPLFSSLSLLPSPFLSIGQTKKHNYFEFKKMKTLEWETSFFESSRKISEIVSQIDADVQRVYKLRENGLYFGQLEVLYLMLLLSETGRCFQNTNQREIQILANLKKVPRYSSSSSNQTFRRAYYNQRDSQKKVAKDHRAKSEKTQRLLYEEFLTWISIKSIYFQTPIQNPEEKLNSSRLTNFALELQGLLPEVFGFSFLDFHPIFKQPRLTPLPFLIFPYLIRGACQIKKHDTSFSDCLESSESSKSSIHTVDSGKTPTEVMKQKKKETKTTTPTAATTKTTDKIATSNSNPGFCLLCQLEDCVRLVKHFCQMYENVFGFSVDPRHCWDSVDGLSSSVFLPGLKKSVSLTGATELNPPFLVKLFPQLFSYFLGLLSLPKEKKKSEKKERKESNSTQQNCEKDEKNEHTNTNTNTNTKSILNSFFLPKGPINGFNGHSNEHTLEAEHKVQQFNRTTSKASNKKEQKMKIPPRGEKEKTEPQPQLKKRKLLEEKGNGEVQLSKEQSEKISLVRGKKKQKNLLELFKEVAKNERNVIKKITTTRTTNKSFSGLMGLGFDLIDKN